MSTTRAYVPHVRRRSDGSLRGVAAPAHKGQKMQKDALGREIITPDGKSPSVATRP
jgi:hypothetical protein